MINNKVCTIINGQFSWELEVDGEVILFQGSSSASYFEKLYKDLGYEVIKVNWLH